MDRETAYYIVMAALVLATIACFGPSLDTERPANYEPAPHGERDRG